MSLCSEGCPVITQFGAESAITQQCQVVAAKLAELGIVCVAPINEVKRKPGVNPFSPAVAFKDEGEYLGPKRQGTVRCGIGLAVDAFLEEKGICLTPAEKDAVMIDGKVSLLQPDSLQTS